MVELAAKQAAPLFNVYFELIFDLCNLFFSLCFIMSFEVKIGKKDRLNTQYPLDIRLSPTLPTFTRRLKTQLFNR